MWNIEIVPMILRVQQKGDTDIKKRLWTQWEKEKVAWVERTAVKRVHTICKTDNGNLMYATGGRKAGAL